MIAQTGSFCFGLAQEPSEDPHRYINGGSSSLLNQDTTCAATEVVSGMVEVEGDPTKLIVGMGLNDCYSRFVIIDKREVARQFFDPFPHAR